MPLLSVMRWPIAFKICSTLDCRCVLRACANCLDGLIAMITAPARIAIMPMTMRISISVNPRSRLFFIPLEIGRTQHCPHLYSSIVCNFDSHGNVYYESVISNGIHEIIVHPAPTFTSDVRRVKRESSLSGFEGGA